MLASTCTLPVSVLLIGVVLWKKISLCVLETLWLTLVLVMVLLKGDEYE